MKVSVVYVYPDLSHLTFMPLALRFVSSYLANPPGQYPHDIHVMINAGNHSRIPFYEKLFSPLPVTYSFHDNTGKDIGAFQRASRLIPCDLMVCLGSPIHFRRFGWLDRIIDTYERNGPGLYGCWAFHQPSDHIRTTAFWCPPHLLATFPYGVGNDMRYEFEHGRRSIVNFTTSLGLDNYMVTWSGCYKRNGWHHVENADCLMLDQFTDKMGYQ